VAEPRITRGGQPWYSPRAILVALPLRAVFRLAFRQAENPTDPQSACRCVCLSAELTGV
jgi:hypothetical protein